MSTGGRIQRDVSPCNAKLIASSTFSTCIDILFDFCPVQTIYELQNQPHATRIWLIDFFPFSPVDCCSMNVEREAHLRIREGTASVRARVLPARVLKEKGSIDEEERGTTKKKNSNIAADQCPDGPAMPGLVKSEIPIPKEKGRTKEFAHAY